MVSFPPFFERKMASSTTRALFIQRKIPVILVYSSNGTDHFGLVGEYLGLALKVVHFDRLD